jgi:NADH dehydrogenase [ubiquinone] 1 alpha subcomplex assembly factor 7
VLAAEIAARGPLPVARFMELALHHYYRDREPFGRAGDFTTAPEISQAFGEILGLWLAQAWTDLDRPAPCGLVELGPGRGTLMADLLRATRRIPGFHEALALHLVETSPPLRHQQAHLPATWHDRFEEVPDGPLLLVANEFLDALPVHQLVCRADGWHERVIALGAAGALAFEETPAPSPLAAPDGTPGQIAELSPARAALAQ